MRHTFETMGTVASIDVDRPIDLTRVRAAFSEVDDRFSLYRADSELSRIADGRLSLPRASSTLIASYERALEWRSATGGLFSPHRPDGVLDLNGIVKAEAIERGGRMLDSMGSLVWSINVGGDILVRSRDEPWATGVTDPQDARALLASVDLGPRRRALASSGSAQRGDHIWRGGEITVPHFAQVSVLADDIVTADVLATAVVAGGPHALDELASKFDIDVLAVGRDGSLLATPGWPRSRALLNA